MMKPPGFPTGGLRISISVQEMRNEPSKGPTAVKSDTRRPSATQEAKWASSSKEHTAQICTLAFKQINRDHELTAYARSVGIDILDHVNWKDGYADVSLERTAERLGYSYNTVTKAVAALVSRGYFRHKPGRQGRGISGRYWPIEKPSRHEGFPDQKPSNDVSKNLHAVKENNLMNNSAPPGARSVRVDREDAAPNGSRPHPRIITGDSDWDSIPDTNEDDNCFRTNDDDFHPPAFASKNPNYKNGASLTFRVGAVCASS
jgi:hypothetical protein